MAPLMTDVFFSGLFMDTAVREPPAPAEHNPEYATKLRALAERLGLPGEYSIGSDSSSI